MTDYRLRPAADSDAAAVAEIWLAGWREAHLAHVPAALAAVRTPESFHSRAARRIGDTVVAITGDGVAGFVMVAGDEVDQVYVAAEHRGTSAAGLLLAEGARLIAAAGHPEAWLAVVASNARARRFYEKCGWHDHGPFDYAARTDEGTVVVPCHRYVKRL